MSSIIMIEAKKKKMNPLNIDMAMTKPTISKNIRESKWWITLKDELQLARSVNLP